MNDDGAIGSQVFGGGGGAESETQVDVCVLSEGWSAHGVGRPLIVSASSQQWVHFTCTTSYPEEDSPSRSAS